MKIELTKDELKFLLEMINVLRFPGTETEKVYKIKKKVEEAIENDK